MLACKYRSIEFMPWKFKLGAAKFSLFMLKMKNVHFSFSIPNSFFNFSLLLSRRALTNFSFDCRLVNNCEKSFKCKLYLNWQFGDILLDVPNAQRPTPKTNRWLLLRCYFRWCHSKFSLFALFENLPFLCYFKFNYFKIINDFYKIFYSAVKLVELKGIMLKIFHRLRK